MVFARESSVSSPKDDAYQKLDVFILLVALLDHYPDPQGSKIPRPLAPANRSASQIFLTGNARRGANGARVVSVPSHGFARNPDLSSGFRCVLAPEAFFLARKGPVGRGPFTGTVEPGKKDTKILVMRHLSYAWSWDKAPGRSAS